MEVGLKAGMMRGKLSSRSIHSCRPVTSSESQALLKVLRYLTESRVLAMLIRDGAGEGGGGALGSKLSLAASTVTDAVLVISATVG